MYYLQRLGSVLFSRVDETEEALMLAPVAHHQEVSKARHIRQVWSILIKDICKRCVDFFKSTARFKNGVLLYNLAFWHFYLLKIKKVPSIF